MPETARTLRMSCDAYFSRQVFESCMWFALTRFASWRPALYLHPVQAEQLKTELGFLPDNVVSGHPLFLGPELN